MKSLTRVATFLFLGALACSAMGATRTAKDSTGALSVTVPSGWTASSKQIMGSKLIIFGPKENGFTVNANVMTEEISSTALDQYAKISESNAPKMIAGYKFISKGRTKLGGTPAGFMVYQGEMGTPPSKIRFKGVFSIRNGVA